MKPGGPVRVLNADGQLSSTQPVEQSAGAAVAGGGWHVLLVRVHLGEHVDHDVHIPIQVAPHPVGVRDEQRTVVIVDEVNQHVPQHACTAAIDQDAVLDRLTGDGAIAYVLA